MDSVRWFEIRKFHSMPIVFNNYLLTFLYISFKCFYDQYTNVVAYTMVLAVGFSSEQCSSNFSLHKKLIQLLQCFCP